jgi:hypothetical protein
VFLLSAVATVERADAQLFGDRTLGSTIQRPTFPDQQAPDMPGAGPSDRRFIRGTAEARTFVGAELLDLVNPVGLQQALGMPVTARSAVEGLREEPQPRVNRLLLEPPPVRPLPYRARLRVDFDYPKLTDAAVTADLSGRLQAAMSRLEPLPDVTVQVHDRTAILEGVVASATLRTLAEQLVRLEPGVSRIENRLQVTEPLPAPELDTALPETAPLPPALPEAGAVAP